VGERPDLDLSGILPIFDRFLRPDEKEPEPYAPEAGDGKKFPEPMRFGSGPDQWSTSTELAVPIVLKWDVNGYYRALGVSPMATRKELREAYQALDGQSSAYLTYVFKQLLNPEIRAAYDAAPLGQPFLDLYTQEDLRRRAKIEAGKRSAVGEFVSSDQVLDEWGYVVLDEGVDSVSPTGQDHSRSTAQRGLRYSYYCWRTNGFLVDTEVLSEWQGYLSAAAARLGVAPAISFGLTAMSDLPYILKEVGGKPVVFFPEGEEPTASVAEQAVEAFTQHADSP
jgi:hypothetical protein